MAGFMKVLRAYAYDGSLTNGTNAGVKNGTLLVRGTGANINKLVKPTADTTTKLLCKAADPIDGTTKTSYHFVVLGINSEAKYYFVENMTIDMLPAATAHAADAKGEGYYDLCDLNNYAVPAGALVRAHLLEEGEEFTTTEVTGTITAGSTYGVKADGTVG